MSDCAGPVSSDRRFQSFVSWYSEVPHEAQRLADAEARQRAATWVPQRFGDDRKSRGQLIAFQLADRWWTLFFERESDGAPKDAENWWIEGYAHDGSQWASNYFYWPGDDHWRHFLHEFRGENYGRNRG